MKGNQKNIQKQSPIPQTPMAFAWYINKPMLLIGSVAFLMVFIGSLLEVSLPYILKKIVDAALATDGATESYDRVLFWVSMVPVSLGVMYVSWRLSGFVGMIWLTRVEADAYKKLYSYTTHHSHSYFNDRFAGSISNKISHASEGTFRLLDSTLWGHFPSLVTFIASGFYIFYTNVLVGIVFIVLICILVPMNIGLAKYRRPHVVKFSENKSAFRGQSVDLLTNISAMRQYAMRSFELSGLQKHINIVRQADLKQWRTSEWILVLNNIAIVLAMGLMMYFMVTFWRSGTVTTGDFVLVVTLIFSLSGRLTFIGNAINQFVRIYGEVEEGLKEIIVPQEITDTEKAKTLIASEARIDWNGVSFDFCGQAVFSDFNLQIPAGQRIGLVGQSGAGKTTFVSLLLRQHDISSGSITINGQNIAEVTQDSLRQEIAVVPQEPALFHRSIRENIMYGNPDATEEEMIEVAKKAQAHNFIMELPKKYETMVGERGVKLSGGQKQRVAIARAMLKDAPILVLDEATSALDSESEVAIQKALETLMEGRTVIAIAHRLSTLRKMDRIIVMERGQIIEDGNHESLATSGGVYERLWNHQAGGFMQD